jgi:hypothetical protein
MNAFKRYVIIDVDGTLYDKFSHDDKKIISKIFENNILVSLTDKILWAINALDFISNPMHLLKFRLYLYSILSCKNFHDVTENYKRRYQNLLLLNLQVKEKKLKQIDKRYNIVFVTSNEYAVEILSKKFKYQVIYAPDIISRRKQIREKNLADDIEYIIGNNYTDDLFLAKRINAISVYVGQSVVRKWFKADFNVLSFEKAAEILKDGS